MKRIIISSLFAACMLTTSAQNAAVEDLFKKVETIMHDGVRRTRANLSDDQTTIEVSALIGTNMFCSKSVCGEGEDYVDSLWNATSPYPEMVNIENNNRLLRFIRHSLDSISALPSTVESYHFETHQSGKDTIRYSICLNRGPEQGRISYDSLKACYVYNRESGPETITFNFKTYPKPCGKHFWGDGYLEYTRAEPLPASNVPANLDEPVHFDWELYLQSIMPILSQKGITQRQFKWAQDEAYAGQPGKDLDKDYHTCLWNKRGDGSYSGAGETNGTYYFIPSDQKAFAEKVLGDIDAATQKYIFLHPEQTYRYRYDTHFNSLDHRINWNQQMLSSTTWNKEGLQDFVYVVADEKGYYFLLFRTKGSLWFPREFSSLKSIINGEKTYFKGMEPKK